MCRVCAGGDPRFSRPIINDLHSCIKGTHQYGQNTAVYRHVRHDKSLHPSELYYIIYKSSAAAPHGEVIHPINLTIPLNDTTGCSWRTGLRCSRYTPTARGPALRVGEHSYASVSPLESAGAARLAFRPAICGSRSASHHPRGHRLFAPPLACAFAFARAITSLMSSSCFSAHNMV